MFPRTIKSKKQATEAMQKYLKLFWPDATIRGVFNSPELSCYQVNTTVGDYDVLYSGQVIYTPYANASRVK